MTLLTAGEVAVLFGVDESWVYRHKDEIGYVRLGPRYVRFTEEKVLAYISSSAVECAND